LGFSHTFSINLGMRSLFLALAILAFGICSAQKTEEIRRSIYFGGGSYYIDENQINELNQWLDSIPNLLDKYNIQLISHTDPIGGKEYNKWLSEMRSHAVEGLLLQRSIPQFKISIKDWGFENPVYSNRTYEGMQMNRRVDVILYPIVF
jgi:outer membrane protein OmpA-like peptidoglycan-associated protein